MRPTIDGSGQLRIINCLTAGTIARQHLHGRINVAWYSSECFLVAAFESLTHRKLQETNKLIKQGPLEASRQHAQTAT